MTRESGSGSQRRGGARPPGKGAASTFGQRSASPRSSGQKLSGQKPSGQRSAGSRFAGSTKPNQPTRLPDRQGPVTPMVDMHDPDGVRLQKLLAAAGVGSRRTCENLITAGRVEVDGQVVTELGTRVDPSRRTVHVDGERVQLDETRVYLAFTKPASI